MSEVIDEKLIKAAIEDDPDAKDTLKKRIKSIVLPTIKKTGIQTSNENSKELMDEIEQKVLNVLHQFLFRVSFETWVYRITFNMILEYQEKTINHQPISQNLNGSMSKT